MPTSRYLLGYAKTLEKVKFVARPSSPPPYSLEEQQVRLLPKLQALEAAAKELPPVAAPAGQVVAVIRMNPQALSRSTFPQHLIRRADWRLLGSISARVRPDGGRHPGRDDERLTTDLFVAARPERFAQALPLLMAQERKEENDALAFDFCNLEDIRLMSPDDRVKSGIKHDADEIEVVLHYNASIDANWREKFTRFAKDVGVQLDQELEIQRSNLLFMPATATAKAAHDLAQFTFVRSVRPLPLPRPLEKPKLLRATTKRSILPAHPSIDPGLTVAVFDGGLPTDHPFSPWATAIEPTPDHDIGSPLADCQGHGLAVTSALLFGSIVPNKVAPVPYCKVDHYRVLGTNTLGKKGHYRALALIDEVLSQREYTFISLSIGPPEPMDNDTVNPWTALLDDQLGEGNRLAFVAVGNNGEDPAPACRIMAPADSVNALGVGSCDSTHGTWSRSSYSATGPGRSPGLVKPDLLHFGGVETEPYLFAGAGGVVLQDCGTSFSTPGLARVGTGLRAHFGTQLSPISLKALLVHGAELDDQPMIEVGWGRSAHDLEPLVVCPDGHAKVIYAGKLQPGTVLRAPILMPPGLRGDVRIRATLCYSCKTDPNTPGDYTRAGLDITFRPNADRFSENKDDPNKKPLHAKSAPFFKRHDFIEEEERRLSAQKWNTVMHGDHVKRVSSLKSPCFDLHYVAREPGRASRPSDAPEIHYALVISLIQERTKDLYDKVLTEFPLQLAVVQPVVTLDAAIVNPA